MSHLRAGRRQRDMRSEWDVIVVGGGLAGLTAGATAAKAGARVMVLEAHGTGGRARTVQREGFTFNMGAHALYAGGVGARVLRDLGVTPRGAAPPLGPVPGPGRRGDPPPADRSGDAHAHRCGQRPEQVSVGQVARRAVPHEAGRVVEDVGGRVDRRPAVTPGRRGPGPGPHPPRAPTPPTSTSSAPTRPSPNSSWPPRVASSTSTAGGNSSSMPWPDHCDLRTGDRGAGRRPGQRRRRRAHRRGDPDRPTGGAGHRGPRRDPPAAARRSGVGRAR